MSVFLNKSPGCSLYLNEIVFIMPFFALGIEVEILFERNEQKDWKGKPDPLR